VRVQIHNEHWKWIVWLFILTLLNAIALAAGRGGYRGDRPSSGPAQQPDQARQSPQPAATPQPAPARESRSASQPAPQPRRTETTTSATQSDAPRGEVRSPRQSDRNNQAASSQNQVRTVESSRPVRHEVIVAPSSQSMDVSSSGTVTRSVSLGTTERTVRPGRNRTVEVKQVQSEQGGNSVSPTSSPLRRDRVTETIGIVADNSKTPLSQGSLSDSNRLPRGNRVDSSQSQPQIVERSRPVRHEVIVAPNSQSLNVSSSQAVVQTSPSNTVEKSTQVKRDRTVEAKQVQSEQGGNSVLPTSSPLRRDRVTETIGIVADNTKTKPQQDSRSDSNRQARSRVEITNQPQSKESKSSTITSSSVTAADTGKSKETAVSSASQPKSDRSKTQIHSDNSRNIHNGTVIRYEGKKSEDRKVEPVVVKTEDITIQPRRSRPSQPDGQQPDHGDQSIKPRSKDISQTPSVIASRTDGLERAHRNVDPESPGRQSDSRWSRLRSKINDQADRDTRSRDGRTDRDDRIRQDENRGRVVVNNNNISVERGGRDDHQRPYVSRHLFSDIGHIRNDHRWNSCGSSFTFRWSDSSCGRVILSPYHNNYGISYYYPSYHRKYLFVSLGGYWPYSYRYQRYYWYGCHPYYWYGSDVVLSPSPVVYDYTTYNYYTTPAAVTTTEAAVTTDLAEDAAATDTPLPQTQADINFAGAVNAFEEGRYENATELFREALLQAPEDEIMPFTYTQALFASGNYALAAYVLREAMAKMPSDEPAIYFPRGLYKDDQTLVNQIAQLESAIVIEPFSTDYQLLLGYQYLGIAQWDKAVYALEQAARNPLNTGVVTKLLDIAEKMEKDVQPTVTAPQS
jgi:hypothetical protein